MNFSKGYIDSVDINTTNTDNTIYPYNLSIFNSFNTLKFNENVTYIVGENGSGKSTLIEAISIAYGFNPEGGSINFSFSTKNSCSELHNVIKLNRTISRPKDGFFLRAESFYNLATNIDLLDEIPAHSQKIIQSYGGKSLHEQSHGESFLSLFLNRFGGNGLYILDEPEAALSSDRQLAFLVRLHDLVKDGSQFIIATHSPVILSYPNATIYELNDDGINKVDYEDTKQFQNMKLFINNYQRILHELLE